MTDVNVDNWRSYEWFSVDVPSYDRQTQTSQLVGEIISDVVKKKRLNRRDGSVDWGIIDDGRWREVGT